MAKFDIASTMNSIMADPKYQSVFIKTAAAKKDDDKIKAEKEKAAAKAKTEKEKEKAKAKAEKEKAKAKADKEKAKAKADKEKAKAKADKEKAKKAKANYAACVMGLSKISEVLDDVGFEKAATLSLLALQSLVKEAEECCSEEEEDCGDSDDEDTSEEDDDEAEDECDVEDPIVMPTETIKAQPPVGNAPATGTPPSAPNAPFDFSTLMGK